MSRAYVVNGVVVSVIGDDPRARPSGQRVDAGATPVKPGWTYSGGAFQAPLTAVKSYAPKQFWQRFTATEREALQNKLATVNQQATKDKLNAFRDYINSGPVEVNDSYVISALNLMVTAGILAAGRPAEIQA